MAKKQDWRGSNCELCVSANTAAIEARADLPRINFAHGACEALWLKPGTKGTKKSVCGRPVCHKHSEQREGQTYCTTCIEMARQGALPAIETAHVIVGWQQETMFT